MIYSDKLLMVRSLHRQPHSSVTQMSLTKQMTFQEKFLIKNISPGLDKGADCLDI